LITVRIENDELTKGLQELQERSADLRPALRVISEDMYDAVMENFDTEGHGQWPPLAKSTLRQLRKKGKAGGKMLNRSAGGLKSSIQAVYDENIAAVGTNKIYGSTHQFGADINVEPRPLLFRKYKRGTNKGRSLFSKESNAQFGMKSKAYTIHIPARPFLALTEENVAQIKQRLIDHLKGN